MAPASSSPLSPGLAVTLLVFGLGFGFLIAAPLGLLVLKVTSDQPAVDRGPPEVELEATEYDFIPEDLEIEGAATIVFRNVGNEFHNALLEGVPGFVAEADAESESTAVLQAEPGTYVLYCSVPGHRELGMVGTVTITAE